MNYLDWTTENCHFVVEILALHQNRLFLMLSGFEMSRTCFLKYFKNYFYETYRFLNTCGPCRLRFGCVPLSYRISQMFYTVLTLMDEDSIQSLHPSQGIPTQEVKGAGGHPWAPRCYRVQARKFLIETDCTRPTGVLFQMFTKILYRSYCRSSLNSMQACKVKHKVHRRSMVSWVFKARADGSYPLLGGTSGFLVAQTFLYQKSLCWNCWEIFSSRV